ncbi:hypothetical protein HBA43_19620 [Providencia rettgeri]|uniref:hypothetical protein n=1 Tax=Providencia TaxID=586 RepID=UPI00141A24AD|nr:hypothetical protein [Providencia rettgeri]ELM3939782.1 hypothetical protein [Providencia rettgeri]EMA4647409.1 hypothetical protein [Providencia rettgeri]NIA76389.1 hypothetical protein [Providencia rettgeri]NIA80600.1 hypothetical protein [Providencia rettgeri]NIB03792.1 hypothetical protein [Providencia rettgeri]
MSDKINELSLKELSDRIDNLEAEKDALEVILAMTLHELSKEQKEKIKFNSYEYHDAMSKLGNQRVIDGTNVRHEALGKILNALRV